VKITSCIKLLRPTQWLKNLMLFFPPFMGGELLQHGIIQKGIMPFFSFCLASSATYIFNDIVDREKDLHHPKKKHRPIPAGKVSLIVAYVTAIVLIVAALFLGFYVSSIFLVILLTYLAISVSYTLKLKQLPIIDLFCISAGFILRLQAGGAIFAINITEWLFLSVFLLSLFLSTGKRLCEKYSMGDDAGNHRKSLLAYPPDFLDGTLYMTGGTVLVTYTMYAITRHSLLYTVPLCCFGLLRYILRVKSGFGGDPTESLLKDAPLFAVGLLWVIMVGWGTYGR
jgi:decaprenyl-phosphate phosphoribosyltransferase